MPTKPAQGSSLFRRLLPDSIQTGAPWAHRFCIIAASSGLACAPSPRPVTDVPASTAVYAPVTGMVDLHAHVFAVAAFGGRWHCGRLEGPESEALKACDGNPRTHAGAHGWFLQEQFGRIGSITDGDTGDHQREKEGHPTFAHWPRWDTVAHMQYWEDHLKRAFDDGLKLMVVQAVDSLAMCQLVEAKVDSPASSATYGCDWGDALNSLRRQLGMAADFAARKSWVEIARTPADARRIIASGKMAWVLGIEADYAWGSDLQPVDLAQRLRDYHTEGVRSFYLAHQLNTRLAGAALYFPPLKTMQWIANCFFRNEDCNSTASDRPPYQILSTNALCLTKVGYRKDYPDICEIQYKAWIDSGKNGVALRAQ